MVAGVGALAIVPSTKLEESWTHPGDEQSDEEEHGASSVGPSSRVRSHGGLVSGEGCLHLLLGDRRRQLHGRFPSDDGSLLGIPPQFFVELDWFLFFFL